MTWTKLGDEFADAARDLSSDAFRTHVEALLWSNRRLLDLVVPKRDLSRFAEASDARAAAEELVAIGWWQDAVDSWYIGVHFAEWQQESAVISHRRKLSAERQQRHRLHKAGDHSMCANTCSVTRDVTPASTRESPRDPGRDGTGRVGSGNYASTGEVLDGEDDVYGADSTAQFNGQWST